MRIVSVNREKKHLVRVACDDGTVFSVDADLFSELSLSPDTVLTAERVAEITEESDYVRAKSRAFWYLDRADHTEKALFDKLIRAGFAPKSCAAVIARLKELGLLDDRRYALRFAERATAANLSRREIYAKLMQKGVPKTIVSETLEAAVPEDESAQIRALLEKKYKNRLSDREDVHKVYAALIRKGFSFGAVRDVLKQYSEELQYANGEEL